MNILHLSAAKTWGGGENHLENLCYELQHLAPEMNNIIFCLDTGEFCSKLEGGNIETIPAPLRFKMDPKYFFKLVRICKKEKIDLIHIHDTTALTLGVMGDYFYELPRFIFSKKTSFPIKNRKRTLHKYNYPKIKRILCVSEETKRVTAQSIQDKEKLVTIYHGTRLDNKSSETPFRLREKLNLTPDHTIIGNIANHIRAKSLDTLIDVADYLVNQQNRKNFIFLQMGRFSKRTEGLQKRVLELKLQEHFYFTGFLPEASNFIPQFDISLVTSQSEGIPGFIYESFYHKIPVVSTNVGGIPEIIENGRNGLLAPMHDVEALGEQVLSLLKDKSLQKEFTQASHRLLINNYSTKTMAEKTLAEYKKVLHGRS